MKNEEQLKTVTNTAIEIAIRLGALFLMLAWCFRILSPFIEVILWGIILALALSPLYNTMNKRLGDKPKWTAFIIILIGLIVLLVPGSLFIESTIHGVKAFKANMEAGTLSIPPPSQKLTNWPFFAAKIVPIWELASENLNQFTITYHAQIAKIGGGFFERIVGAGKGIMHMTVSIIIAGILLATKGTNQFATKLFHSLVGDKAAGFVEVIQKTVGNVTKGMIGVAFIQALLVGLGFLFAGVPYAGIWTLMVFLLCILAIPPIIIVVPVAVYLFSVINPIPATIWTVYLILAGASDNVLKPMIMGKGAPVPMLVIYLGVIGGFIYSGFIGLFTGAIIISLGYKLFIAWMEGNDKKAQEKENA